MRVLGYLPLVDSSQQRWALSLTLTLFGTPERVSGGSPVSWGAGHGSFVPSEPHRFGPASRSRNDPTMASDTRLCSSKSGSLGVLPT